MSIFSDEFQKLAKTVWLFVYNSIGFWTSGYLLLLVLPALLGWDDSAITEYANPNGQLSELFRGTELFVFVELLNHQLELKKAKRHIVLPGLWAFFITYFAIPVYSTHNWVLIWVFVRSARKTLRYLHRLYLQCGLRNEIYCLEWTCISGLTFLFPLEYLVSVIILLVNFPVARLSPSMQLEIGKNLSVNLSIAFVVALFVSLPYFLCTLVYLCTKRTHQLQLKQQEVRKRKVTRAKLVSEDESD